MLILTRKANEKIVIDGGITITVVRIKGNIVRLGIEAPRQTSVVRAELPRKPATQPATEEAAEETCMLNEHAVRCAAHAACDEPAPLPRPLLSLRDWRADRRQQQETSSVVHRVR